MCRRTLHVIIGATVYVAVALTAGCQGTPASMASGTNAMESGAVTASVRQLFGEYVANVIAGNADRWLTLWDASAVQLPPDAPMVVGKDTLARKVKAGFAPGVYDDMKITIQEVKTSGELAFARGIYTTTVSKSAGGGGVDGKFLTVFKRQTDGSWKIYRDCFNSNVPPVR